MEHNLFKAKSLEEGIHNTVGDCNGIPAKERWDKETPIFAKEILKYADSISGFKILDYGTGVGRLAKEILVQDKNVTVIGLDASQDQLNIAKQYVDDKRFIPILPEDLNEQVDLVYCIYCLQHVPSVELRDVLNRIHTFLKPGGKLIYCSSDYRMAIRFDGQGFFDDRFLGVNIREEISRLFSEEGDLFVNNDSLDPVVKKMVWGDLPHPAKIYKRKDIVGSLFNAKAEKQTITTNVITCNTQSIPMETRKLLLVNRLAPGDILVMTNAIRDLHQAYPGKFITDVRTPCNEIFDNSPYITKLQYDENEFNKINDSFQKSGLKSAQLGDILVIDMQYPLIHRSGLVGAHFSEGHRDFLEEVLNIKIRQTEITPEIYLTGAERDWISPVLTKTGYSSKYWIINAGSKGDYTLKQYPYYQEVVDLLKNKIKFVQIGQGSHLHKPLDGVIDMVDKTNVRELFRAIWCAEGVLTCVSFPMHIAAAFKKPCVVVAGAREGTRWELYPNHQFMYVNGCLPCATYDGCWKSKQSDCTNKVNDVPKCMTIITPKDVARSVERYYDGGMLNY